MAKALETRLLANGCDLVLDEFQDRLVEILGVLFSAYTVDEMLLHPDDAKYYCATVRRDTGYNGLPDDLILRCLMHRRKNP